MSINRTQQFLYFQNKTKHYDNILKIKPKIDDKLSKSLSKTIDHSNKKYNQPHLKRYSIDIENQKMINRLVGIVSSKRKQVQIGGDYSRYNDSQRKFRLRNPYRDQVNRKIEEENIGIVNKLSNAKPLVGSTQDWMHEYQRKLSHRRNLSRYLASNKSKQSLHISTQKFMPQHYKNLLDYPSEDNNTRKSRVTVVTKQKLISFPKLLIKQKSNSLLSRSKSKQTLEL